MAYGSSRFRLLTLSTVFIFFIVYFLYSASYTSNEEAGLMQEHDDDIDHRLFNQGSINKDACNTNTVIRNTDPNHVNAHIDMWRRLSNEAIEVYRKRWQRFITSVKRENNIPPFEGQGIVIVAGNRDTFHRALNSIKILRHMHHCDLDIEVWHLSDEQPSVAVQNELAALGAVAKDLSDPNLPRPIQSRRNADKQFQIKAAAVINSSFKEVLYLDSDNIPARDPTFLFDTPEYKKTGALFWPDFWKTHGDNKIFEILHISCRDEWEQESGQMVIDKVKSWLPLQLAWYMQDQHEIYFQFLNGDKDTFKYAWQALNAPYHMIEAFLGMAGAMAGDRFCGHTMLQYYPTKTEDLLLFVHANLYKITDRRHFINSGTPNATEHPWDLSKRSTFSHLNTWIKPEFYISADGRACMDFTHREGEPNAITENFDSIVPNLQSLYIQFDQSSD